MGLKPDHWIRKMAREHQMITPFEDSQVREGVISYGVSSYGYDIRVADEFKIFTNVFSAVVDPKNFDTRSMVDFRGEVCVIPPNSFALARTVEYFRIPRSVLTICVGKCVTGDTRVVDADTGDYLPIEEFVSRRRSHTLVMGNWSLKSGEVQAHFDQGIQPVYRLTTRAGLQIKTTAGHPFRTLQSWKPLGELSPGDRIAVARSIPVFGKAELPAHEAILLGFMLSDGQCRTPGSSPRFTNEDPRLVEVMTAAARAFGGDVSPVGRYGHNLVNRRGRGGAMSKNRYSAWLEGLHCNVGAGEKAVPALMFRAQRASVKSFLQALFSGDGNAHSARGGAYLEYSTSSPRLAYDVRHLLLRFGIFALLREKHLPGGGKSYRLQITDKAMILRFAHEIGFIPGSRKQRALEDIISRGVTTQPAGGEMEESGWSNFDTLPPEAWAPLRERVHATGHSLRSLGIDRTQPDQSLPYSIARRAMPALEATDFASLLNSDVVWDTVRSIEPLGMERVYDLTVPNGSNFVANDILVHNSTYARCGIIVNVTPFEPQWEGYVTLEISNTTPLPARIYANEGIAQVLFFEADEECEFSYADKKGKYQKQQSIVLPKL